MAKGSGGGANLSNIANRAKPGMGPATKLSNSSPGFDGLGNIAERSITPRGFSESSPEFGTLGTVTRNVRAGAGKKPTNLDKKHSPGIG